MSFAGKTAQLGYTVTRHENASYMALAGRLLDTEQKALARVCDMVQTTVFA